MPEQNSMMRSCATPFRKVAMACTAVAATFAVCMGVSFFNADTAYADMPVEYSSSSYTDHITVGVAGKDTTQKFTVDTVQDLNPSVTGYLYKKTDSDVSSGYRWVVLAAKNTVTLDDLLKQTVVDPSTGETAYDSWKNGASLRFYAMEKNSASTSEADAYVSAPYTKGGDFGFTYADLQGQDDFFLHLQQDGTFYQNNKATAEAPAAIAFNYTTGNLSGTADSTLTNLKFGNFTSDVRFVMGLDIDTLEAPDGSSVNMGRRFPYGLVGIEVVPAGYAA